MRTWLCKKCGGSCCSRFILNGPPISKKEWRSLLPRLSRLSKHLFERTSQIMALPVVGKSYPKACVFLKDSKCSIYASRPQACREYPFRLIEKEKTVIVRLDEDCPKVSELGRVTIDCLPNWIRAKAKNKKIKIEVCSFLETSSRFHLDEEN